MSNSRGKINLLLILNFFVNGMKKKLCNSFPNAIYRLANIYFLVLSIIMMIGTYFPKVFDSPLTPWSTLGPLCVVLMFTMIKEAFEDIKRHQHDDEVGKRPCLILQEDGAFAESKWEDIKVGNVIKLKSGDAVPADMLILSTSEDDGICFVETSNIDGETNLKQKRSVRRVNNQLTYFPFLNMEDMKENLKAPRFEIACELPNGNIHVWEGYMQGFHDSEENSDDKVVVDDTNFLLRGSSVQNISWMHGIVIYTGSDTKLAKNASKPRLKISNIEKTTNYLIRMIFALMFIICTVSTVALLIFRKVHDDYPYLQGSGDSFDLPFAIAYWLTFLILYSNLLPMSLYVTLEMVNYAQAYFIDNDLEMYDPLSGTPARAVTSNLNSDLGQIEYIFSDKTGTLTQNVMVFRRCFIGGKVYGKKVLNTTNAAKSGATSASKDNNINNDDDNNNLDDNSHGLDLIQQDLTSAGQTHALFASASSIEDNTQKEELDAFFTCLAVAHTVVIDENAYRAESPDEKALCEGAKEVGFMFKKREGSGHGIVVIEKQHLDGKEERYEVLAVNEFTSARKRMSALVKTEKGKYIILAKGADNIMLERKKYFGFSKSFHDDKSKQLSYEARMNSSLQEFANDGLRTLLLGMREVSASEAENWITEFKKAQSTIGNREESLAKVAEKIEKDFLIIGVTAIEDKLQDGVSETLEALRQAGIKIWVLTGDKLETAVNIGYSSRLLDESMRMIEIQGESHEEVEKLLNKLTRRKERGNFNDSMASFNVSQTNNASSGAGATSSGLKANTSSASISVYDLEAGRDLTVNLEPDTSMERRASNNNSPRLSARVEDLAMAVTGKALTIITKDSKLTDSFLDLALSCKVVLACRVSPAQKAEVVKLVKKNAISEAKGKTTPTPITLAIGDGANDVSMIQEAQVGVGISGKEGMQAVNASDFAIAQFRFLRRLLLVHGRWSYRRMSKVVLYSLYKNFVLVLTLFAYQAYCAFSGISLYEPMVQAGYNFFLGLPPVSLGMFDREISSQFALKNPQLYISGRKNLNLTPQKLSWRIFEALVHSMVIFGLPIAVASHYGLNVPLDSTPSNVSKGHMDKHFDGTPDIYVLGTTHYTCLIIVMQYKILFDTNTITLPTFGLWVFSILFYFSFLTGYSSIYILAPEYYGVALKTLAMPELWNLVVICTVSCFVFDSSIKLGRLQFKPHAVDILIERDRAAQEALAEYERLLKKESSNSGLSPLEEQSLVEHHRYLLESKTGSSENNDESNNNNGSENTSNNEKRQNVSVSKWNAIVQQLEDVKDGFFKFMHDQQEKVALRRKISLTPSELDAMGIHQSTLRSSYDYSYVSRLEPKSSNDKSNSNSSS